MDMIKCEYFTTIPVPRVCDHINDERALLATFFKGMEPPMRCPIKPGIYRFENSTIDLNFFTTFPLEGYRWQSRLRLYTREGSAKKEVYCLDMHCTVKWFRNSTKEIGLGDSCV